jgi:hypothetical protein
LSVTFVVCNAGTDASRSALACQRMRKYTKSACHREPTHQQNTPSASKHSNTNRQTDGRTYPFDVPSTIESLLHELRQMERRSVWVDWKACVVPACSISMWCQHVVSACGVSMWCQHVVSARHVRMECQRAMSACNVSVQCQPGLRACMGITSREGGLHAFTHPQGKVTGWRRLAQNTHPSHHNERNMSHRPSLPTLRHQGLVARSLPWRRAQTPIEPLRRAGHHCHHPRRRW